MLNTLYAVTLATTIWATVVAIAIAEGPRQVVAAAAARTVVGPLMLLSVVGVPAFVLVTTTVTGVSPEHTVGLMLMAAAGAGTLSVRMVVIAGGDRSLAIALTLLSEILAIVAIPVWMSVLSSRAIAPPVADVVTGVIVYIVAPLLAGWGIRAAIPAVAARLAPILQVYSAVGLALIVVLVLALNLSALAAVLVSAATLTAILTVLVASGTGWFLGGRNREARITGALVGGVRASAPALGIAAAAFGDAPGVRVAIVDFGVCTLVLAYFLAHALSRGRDAAPHVPRPAVNGS